jgi:hypothetical protein
MQEDKELPASGSSQSLQGYDEHGIDPQRARRPNRLLMVGILVRTPTMHVEILASGALSHLRQGHEPSMKRRPSSQ